MLFHFCILRGKSTLSPKSLKIEFSNSGMNYIRKKVRKLHISIINLKIIIHQGFIIGRKITRLIKKI